MASRETAVIRRTYGKGSNIGMPGISPELIVIQEVKINRLKMRK
jgi:hypothetical protein